MARSLRDLMNISLAGMLGVYSDDTIREKFKERLDRFLEEQKTGEGGIKPSAEADKFFADFQALYDKGFYVGREHWLAESLLRQYNLQRDPSTIQTIFGGKYEEAPPTIVTNALGDKSIKYEDEQRVRSNALKNALGEEIYSLGLKDKEGKVIVPEKLIDFAEYKPLTNEEKELSQSGMYNPLKNRKEELHALTTGAKKLETGSDTREMLKKAGKMGIAGIGSALGSSEGTSEMQSSFDRLANRAAAQNAMDERITQFKDKQDATTKLSKFKSEMLAEDVKRKEELMKLKSKTAVSLTGAHLTASEHAAQLAKANL